MKHIILLIFVFSCVVGKGQTGMPDVNDYVSTGCKIDRGFNPTVCDPQWKRYMVAYSHWLYDDTLPNTSYGEKSMMDTHYYSSDSAGFGHDANWYPNHGEDWKAPKYDTVPCMILCSDTNVNNGMTLAVGFVGTSSYSTIHLPGTTLCLRGYEVREGKAKIGFSSDDGHLITETIYTHFAYLDAAKNKLTYYVWMSQTVN